MCHSRPLAGLFWRSTFKGQEDTLLAPAQAPNGRWHHDGQKALYLSQTPEGCRIALKVYVENDDPDRLIYPIAVKNAHVVDLRDADTRSTLGTSLSEIHAFWADLMTDEQAVPTWRLSDKLREMGVDGLLSPSRSRPDLTHLTLFRWNEEGGPRLDPHGAPVPFQRP